MRHSLSITNYERTYARSTHLQELSLIVVNTTAVRNPLTQTNTSGLTRKLTMVSSLSRRTLIILSLTRALGKRYTCVHANCLPKDDLEPRYFPTWSALQSHIRTDHPPTCPHLSCNGRTFSNPGNLRAHLKLHQQREAEMEIDEYLDSGDDSEQPAKKRRRGGEHGRDWKCEIAECGKDFKSVSSGY